MRWNGLGGFPRCGWASISCWSKDVRVPYEPLLQSWRASGTAFFSRLALWLFMTPWNKLLKARLRRAGVRSNEYVFGLNDSGQMDVYLVLRMLRHLPDGVTEMYF